MGTINIGNIIRAYNVYSSIDIKADEVTMFNFMDRVTSIMKRKQVSYAYLSMHKTNLQRNPFSPNEPLEEIQEKEESYIFLEDIEEVYFLNPVIQENGTILKLGNTPAFISGKYLILLVFSNDEGHSSKIAPSIASRIVNAIRITHGIKSAEVPVYKCFFDAIKNTVSVNSDGFPIYIAGNNPSDDLSALSNFGIKKINNPLMNHDADILFNIALKEIDPEIRFLFLWLCFDSILPGKERRNLFFNQLSSCTANNEVLRLFSLRNEIAHGIKAKVGAKDCISVLWAIRIAVCPDQEIQKHICMEYEKWITSHHE